MKRDYILELHIVIRSKDLQQLRNTEERLGHLIINKHVMESTYEIAGGIREADDGEETS